MEVSPAITEIGDQVLPADNVDKDDDEEDLCRICRSPEESGNPLKYPCACRGSIKYVHEECLRLWLDRRRGNKKCEVCGISYCIVPLYSENAPEKLPCHEFLIGVLLRVWHYMNLILPWVLAFLLNTLCFSMHPWGQEYIADLQRDIRISRKFPVLSAGLIYGAMIMFFVTFLLMIRLEIEEYNIRRLPGGFCAEIFIGNGLGQRVIGGVVHFLWQYMKILCDWYFLKLIHLFGQPVGRIFVPQNAALDEFGAIRRLFFFVDDNGFAVLAISVYVHIVFVLLPFSIGWTVLATVGGSFLRNSPVILGYAMLLSYFGILFTLSQVSFPALVRWFWLGFHYISSVNMPRLWWNFSVKTCKNLWWCAMRLHYLPCLLWNFSVEACEYLFVVKDAFVFCFKIGFLPWIIGRWLEICTSPMFRTTISQRLEDDVPVLVWVHWLSGTICLLIAGSNMDLIQKIVHRRAFWFLVDVTDPGYKITKLNLGYTFFVFASHAVLLVILSYLPIKAIMLINPSFFPLELWVTNDNSFIGSVVKYQKFELLSSGPRWLIKHTRPAITLIVQHWIVTVSSWLQLSDFLLVVPQGEGVHRADQNARPLIQPRRQLINEFPWLRRLYSIAEGSMIISHESQNVEEDIKDQSDHRLLPRIALLLVLAALTLFLLSTAFMALPILVGRVFFESISFLMIRFELKHDDFCAFWIGCFILRRIYISTCFLYDHIQKGRTILLLKSVFIWIRNGLIFSIWIFVIPGLLGLLIDLMIVIPLRVPLNKSPVYFFIQDWVMGVVVLHLWIIMTMLTPVKSFATEAWRRKLERIENVGIQRLPSTWLLRDVIGCIIITFLITLSIPYLLAKYLFPLLGFSQSINLAVERLIWPALLGLIVVWFMVKLTRDLVIYLHQSVFNERYLVGERVDNLTEDREQRMVIHGV